MNEVLERNLEQLLRRAYRPARPAEDFRRALRARILARLDDAHARTHVHGNPRGRRPLAWTAAAAAAAVLVGLTALLWSGAGDGARARDVEAVLALGDAAWRRAPAGAWIAAASPTLAVGAHDYLEVATPGGRGLTVGLDLAEGGERAELAVAPRSRVAVLAPPGGPARIELGSGALRVRGAPAGGWTVVTSEAGLEAVDADLELAYVEPDRVPAALRHGLDGGRPVLRLDLSDRARLGAPGGGDGVELAEGRHYLQSGHPLGALDGGAPGPGRDPVDEAPAREAGAERADAIPAGALAGRVLDGAAGAPIPAFTVWLRVERRLPDVALPEPHDVEHADGRFLLSDLEPGTYTVLVEAPGFAAWKRHGVAPGAGLDVRLGRGAGARGFVLDAQTGAPVEGALVIAEQDVPHQVLAIEGPELERLPRAVATTDANGAYELSCLSAGEHQLRAGCPGYAPEWTATFSLEPSEPGTERPMRELPHVHLGRGGRIAGRIERADGTPWSGAQVVASLLALGRPQPVYTYGAALAGADGRYAIDHLPPGHYAVLHVGDEAAPVATPQVQQTTVERGETRVVDFVTTQRETRLEGRAAGADGTPLADYRISLAPVGSAGLLEDWVATSTDGEGRFTFEAVAPGEYGVYVSPSFTTLTRRGTVTVPAVPVHTLEVRLPRTALSGTARTESGAPAAGAMVVLLGRSTPDGPWDFAGKGAVAADGTFRFEGLDEGRYRLAAIGRTPAQGSGMLPPLALAEDDPATVEIPMTAGGPLEIEVVDADGAPVAGASVAVVDAGGLELPYAAAPTTDLDGLRRIPGIAAGRWTVRASAPGHRDASRAVEVERDGAQRERLVLARER